MNECAPGKSAPGSPIPSVRVKGTPRRRGSTGQVPSRKRQHTQGSIADRFNRVLHRGVGKDRQPARADVAAKHRGLATPPDLKKQGQRIVLLEPSENYSCGEGPPVGAVAMGKAAAVQASAVGEAAGEGKYAD